MSTGKGEAIVAFRSQPPGDGGRQEEQAENAFKDEAGGQQASKHQEDEPMVAEDGASSDQDGRDSEQSGDSERSGELGSVAGTVTEEENMARRQQEGRESKDAREGGASKDADGGKTFEIEPLNPEVKVEPFDPKTKPDQEMKGEESSRRRPRRTSAKQKKEDRDPQPPKRSAKPRGRKTSSKSKSPSKAQAAKVSKQSKLNLNKATTNKSDAPGQRVGQQTTILLNRPNRPQPEPEKKEDEVEEPKLEATKSNRKEKSRPKTPAKQEVQEVKEVQVSPAILEWQQKEEELVRQGLEAYNTLKLSIQQSSNASGAVRGQPDGQIASSNGSQNHQQLTESEKAILVEDMKSFFDSKSSDEAEAFKLRDICKVPIFKLIAPTVDSSQLGITELTTECEKLVIENLKSLMSTTYPDYNDRLALLDGGSIFKKTEQLGDQIPDKTANLVQDLIKINAERRPYGFRNAKSFGSKKANVEAADQKLGEEGQENANDEGDRFIGCTEVWELTNANFYLSAKRCKELQSEQRARTQASSELRALEKVLQLLERLKNEKDVCKLQTEYEKYQAIVKKGLEHQKKEQEFIEQKRERDRIEEEKQKLREQERQLKIQEKERKERERQLLKQQKEEQLLKEKQEKQERMLLIKKQQEEKRLKEEQERKARQQQIEQERLEKQMQREREKEQRLKQKEEERQEKLKKQQEEEERKAREEEQLRRLRPNITKFFGKAKDDPVDQQVNQSKEIPVSQSQKDENAIDRLKEYEKKIDDNHKTYQTMTESLHLQKRFQLIAFNKCRPLGKLMDAEAADPAEVEKENKRMIAQYFQMMNGRLDLLANSRKNRIHIAYPINEKSAGLTEQQKELMPSGTVLIKHTSPLKENGATKEHQSKPQHVILRKKCIIIEDEIKSLMRWKTYQINKSAPTEDSTFAMTGKAQKSNSHEQETQKQNSKKSMLTCRNPFKVDENLINYDLDSEDEWAEEHGEDLQDADCQKLSDDDEDDLAEQEAAKGFIVDDDYLSVSEMNYSFESDAEQNDALLQVDLQRRKAILEKKRQNQLHLKNRNLADGPQIFLYHKDSEEVNWSEYAAVSFMSSFQTSASEAFPLELKKIKQNIDYDAEDKKSGFDPNAINLKLVELVKMVHGSFDSKPKLIDDFHEQHPECSKNSIERKLKDFFIKDKRNDDPRQRYYANDEVLDLVQEALPGGQQNDELLQMARTRLQPILEEIQMAEREQEEKRRCELLQKEQERLVKERIKREELDAKEQKRKEEKIERDREREEQKEQKRLLAEEEKQRKQIEKQKLREIKAKEKEQEILQKNLQKEKDKMERHREKEKRLEMERELKEKKVAQKLHEKQGKSKQAPNAAASEPSKATQSVIKMLQKRQSTDLQAKRAMHESPVKVQKPEGDEAKPSAGGKREPKPAADPEKPSAPAVSAKIQITSFFSKMAKGALPVPPVPSPTPAKLQPSAKAQQSAKQPSSEKPSKSKAQTAKSPSAKIVTAKSPSAKPQTAPAKPGPKPKAAKEQTTPKTPKQPASTGKAAKASSKSPAPTAVLTTKEKTGKRAKPAVQSKKQHVEDAPKSPGRPKRQRQASSGKQ